MAKAAPQIRQLREGWTSAQKHRMRAWARGRRLSGLARDIHEFLINALWDPQRGDLLQVEGLSFADLAQELGRSIAGIRYAMDQLKDQGGWRVTSGTGWSTSVFAPAMLDPCSAPEAPETRRPTCRKSSTPGDGNSAPPLNTTLESPESPVESSRPTEVIEALSGEEPPAFDWDDAERSLLAEWNRIAARRSWPPQTSINRPRLQQVMIEIGGQGGPDQAFPDLGDAMLGAEKAAWLGPETTFGAILDPKTRKRLQAEYRAAPLW